MIELIFALVIMGIVLMSAPTLIATATSSVSVALQQEGINEASSRINMILTYAWDQNDTNASCTPPILHVSAAGDSDLAQQTNGRRIGVPLNSNSHSYRCGLNELNASSIGIEGGVFNDIDDFAGTSALIDLETTDIDYIEKGTVSLTTSVNYISDSAFYRSQTFNYIPGGIATGTTNIKQIQVTLTSSSGIEELSKTITLNAFSCNIGGYEYHTRTF